MKTLLSILYEHNWILSSTADKAAHQYNLVSSNSVAASRMCNFKRREQRLDHFWFDLMKIVPEDCEELKTVIKTTLILSHGNANVERGFPVNKQCIVENMEEETLVAHRLIHDTLNSLDGLETLFITRSLITSVREAHSRYVKTLKEKNKLNTQEKEQKNKRKMKTEKIKELSTKKQKLLEDTRKEIETIDAELKNLTQNETVLEENCSIFVFRLYIRFHGVFITILCSVYTNSILL